LRNLNDTESVKEFYSSFLYGKDSSTLEEMADVFEEIIENVYRKILQNGDIAIDMGAHAGRHTLPMAETVGVDGLVLAIDPLENQLKYINLYAQQQNMSDIIVTCQVALSNFQGNAEFFIIPDLLGYSSLLIADDGPTKDAKKEVVQVKVNTLDALVRQLDVEHKKISFIKADLEGGEYHAFLGGLKTIKKHRPVIAFENNRYHSAELFDYTKAEFFDFFSCLDYLIYDVTGVLFDESLWEVDGPWYSFAIPKESQLQSLIYSEINKLFKI